MEAVQTLGKSDSLEDWGSTNAELAAAPAVQPPASPVRKQSTVLADKQRKLSSAMQVKATAAKARLAEKKSRMSTWSAGVKDKVAKETGKVSHGMVAFLFAEGEGDDDDAPELARKNQALLARISQLENDLSCAEGLNVRATDALVVAHDVVVALQVLVQPPACLHTLTRPLPQTEMEAMGDDAEGELSESMQSLEVEIEYARRKVHAAKAELQEAQVTPPRPSQDAAASEGLGLEHVV